jgi:hypothetical protein
MLLFASPYGIERKVAMRTVKLTLGSAWWVWVAAFAVGCASTDGLDGKDRAEVQQQISGPSPTGEGDPGVTPRAVLIADYASASHWYGSGVLLTTTYDATVAKYKADWLLTATHVFGADHKWTLGSPDTPRRLAVYDEHNTKKAYLEGTVFYPRLHNMVNAYYFGEPHWQDVAIARLSNSCVLDTYESCSGAPSVTQATLVGKTVAYAGTWDQMEAVSLLAEGFGAPDPQPTARHGRFQRGALLHDGNVDNEDMFSLSSRDGYSTLAGDSGGPTWVDFPPFFRFLAGIHSGSNIDTGIWAFKSWMEDVLAGRAYNPRPGHDNWSFCTGSSKCNVGEGDCDSVGTDAQCLSGLVCKTNAASKYGGADPGNELCLPSRLPDTPRLGSTACSAADPCGPWEGSCDNHSECMGDLLCRPKVSRAVDASKPNLNVCDFPRSPSCPDFNLFYDDTTGNSFYNNAYIPSWAYGYYKDTREGWCTPECPCGVGDGDCNTDDDCRGELKCLTNVGTCFGFRSTETGRDICVTPEVYAVRAGVRAVCD